MYFKDRTLIFPEQKTAIITDIHFSSELSNRTFNSIQKRMRKLVDEENISTLILLGDIFNEFPYSEKGIEIIKSLQKELEVIFFVLGNHEEKIGGFEGELPQIVKKQEMYLRHNQQTYGLLHGHKEPKKSADTYIIGHLHPHYNGKPCVITLKEQYNNADIILLPAFSNRQHKKLDFTNSPLITEDNPLYSIEKQF